LSALSSTATSIALTLLLCWAFERSGVAACGALGRIDPTGDAPRCGELDDNAAPDSPELAISASETIERWRTVSQADGFAALVRRLVADSVEVGVVLVDASRPALRASPRLIAPLQGPDRTDRHRPVAREVEQLNRLRGRTHPARACGQIGTSGHRPE
jgi:hypothetical protein